MTEVTEVRQATGSEWDAWQEEWRAQLESWYGTPDVTAEWASYEADRRMASRKSAAIAATLALTSGGERIAVLALSAADQGGARLAFVNDIWVTPEHRRQGYAIQALDVAGNWARDNGAASIWVSTNPAEPAHAALFASYPVRARQMIKKLSAPGPLADGLEGRPMNEAEFADWRAESVRGYAADMMNSGSIPKELAAAEAARQFDVLLPNGLSTADHSFLSLYSGGELVATNWIGHQYAPGTSWVFGVEVSEQHRGKGYGRAAMVIGERATIGAGDTHLGLNVFGHNDVAINLYNAMGYRAYEHNRSIDI